MSIAPATLPAAWFIRGDVNASGAINVTDAIQVFRFLFLGDPAAVGCPDAADLDDNGKVSITDGIYLLSYLFQSGPPPKTSIRGCWFDRTDDALDCPIFAPCDSMGVFIVADRSASMADLRWTIFRREALLTLSSLPEQSHFGVVFFSNQIAKFPASGQPADANPAMKASAIAFITSTQTDHGSCALEGLVAGLTYAALSNRKVKEIVIFSDGEPTCNGRSGAVYQEEILSSVKKRNVSGALIHAFGINPTSSGDSWLRKLAVQNGGSYVRITQ